MFGNNKSPSLDMIKGDGETAVSKTTNFEGNLKSDGAVRIYGHFRGQIETAGSLIIGKSAEVHANVKARNVAIGGLIHGNIDAKGKVEIFSGGRVYGDIDSYALCIEEGAIFSGRSQMRDKVEERVLQDVIEEPLAETRRARS